MAERAVGGNYQKNAPRLIERLIMKTIQWFPGHMAKAMRMMEENLSLVDAVVFVLDARAPAATFNRKLRDMVGQKPVLYVLNKADLSDGGADAIVSAMKGKGCSVLKVSASSPACARPIAQAMNGLVKEKLQRMAEKGQTKPLRFLIAGVPNTGKSTLINLLSGSKRAVTGDKAGVTRQKQWVRCGSFELMDTPGTMPPSFDNQQLARRLAFIGSINDDILETDEIALGLLEEMSGKYLHQLNERYRITGGTPLEMLDAVCLRRGFVMRGNDFDYDRGANALIDDFRKGRIGKVCFDSVEDAETVGLI